jgi:serine/threonine protein kinase
VREKHTPRLYALKAFHKSTDNSKVRIREVALNTAINEKDALTELSGNGFTLPIYASFHDAENYYLVTVRAEGFQPTLFFQLWLK